MRRSLLVITALVAACSRPPAVPERSAPAPVKPAAVTAPLSIDPLLREAWQKAGIVPEARADDATFLRRAYLDITGTIPRANVTLAFLADGAPNKRADLVDRLLASPEYAEHWTNYWDDVLMGRAVKEKLVDRTEFRAWLRERFAANAPWDRIVRELVSATGRSSRHDDETAAVNGAVNWTLRYAKSPQDLGGSASRVFLGVQIQCAQCHDHKTEAWRQDDFRRFASAFLRAEVEPLDPQKGMMGTPPRVDLVDSAYASRRFLKNAEVGPVARAKPTALDGTDLDRGAETRKALAAWMTSRDNAWFAKAFVNRMWSHFLGRGFYDPVDDIRPSNPAVAPEILDRLAADFVAHGFDVRHLVRTIARSEAYQLASSGPERALWARFRLVPLGPDELLDAVYRATDLEITAERAGIDRERLRASVDKRYSFVFDTDEEPDAPDRSGTVTQALTLLNGALVGQASRALPGSTTFTIVNTPGTDAERIDALALRVLSRHPTAEERERWVAYVTKGQPSSTGATPKTKGPLDRLANKRREPSSPKQAAYEDLLWSMLNSSEFTFNH